MQASAKKPPRPILVIDDEHFVRKIVCDNLALSGFLVIQAADGEQGLALIDPEAPPGLVITDLIMPKGNGLELIAEVKKRLPGVGVIAISGGGRVNEVEDLLEKARCVGADAVLPKPLDMDELERLIGALWRDV